MAETLQQRRGKTAAAARQAGTRPGAARAARKPAYLQAKLAVSTPGDPQEREADRVAQQIGRTPRAGVARDRLAPGTGPIDPDQTLRPRLRRQEETGEEPLQARLQRQPMADEEELQTPLHRQADGGEQEDELLQTGLARQGLEQEQPLQARLWRQVDAGEEEETLQTGLHRQAVDDEQPLQAEGGAAAAGLDPATEQRIEQLRGQGDPLPEAARRDMAQQFGRSFTKVRIHTDGEAAELCARLSARAFTVGHDIFFAAGEFAPDTTQGRQLLAHELTHVVQNGKGAARLLREVSPMPDPAPPSGSPAAARLAELSVLDLPPIKHRHAALYTGAGARRAAGYRRNTSQSQVSVWNNGIGLEQATIEEKLRERDPDFTTPSSPNAMVNLRAGSRTLSTRWGSLRNRLLIPDWDRRGRQLVDRADRFQVDHLVELQVFGDTSGNAGNVIGNLELLKGSPNASSGSTIRNSIYAKVTAYLAASDPAFSALSAQQQASRRRQWLSRHTITFTEMRRAAGRGGDDADWWTRSEIEAAAPLEAVEPAPATRLEGSSGNFVLASGPGGVEIARYRYRELDFEPASERLRTAMAGIRIDRISLSAAAEQGNAGAGIGTLSGSWDLPDGFRADEPVQIPLVAVGPYAGAPGEIPGLNTDFAHLSPVSLAPIELRDGRLYAEGQIRPSLPLLRDHPIAVTLDGSDLQFQVEFTSNLLSLPLPGVSLDEGSIALHYSTREGFGGTGRVEFSIEQLGAGHLEVQASQRAGFAATGEFNFDSELFDRAAIRVWYRDAAFGGEGEIGIDNPDKIRGIRSANLSVGFGDHQFHADGEVQPDIPGVEQAGLRLAYSEAEGLTIGGSLALSSEVPGIQSGSIDVTVRKQEGEWRVSASGTAVPAIPGIDSQLTAAYDDGAFNAEVQAGYRRGMLQGQVHAGATNRALDDQGNPTGEPGEAIRVFGGGSVSVQIAPWLQGTVGIRFAPNGEVTVSGEIGLPGQLEIFPRRELDKSIFNIAVQAPIVPGIVAEIGGGLSATAGIGPGVIDQLRLGIEYNPAHEENTHVTGDAHLNVPSDAGLRLAVRAGIGLGITGASATGGLEIGGTLGISGAAEAGVHIDWMPSTGLDLTADLAIHAQPSFTFDLSGYVSVRALGFSVYDNRWELASFQFGSDYRFGIRLPVHYHEGEPFDIALEDVEFEVPNIDTGQLLRGLIARVT